MWLQECLSNYKDDPFFKILKWYIPLYIVLVAVTVVVTSDWNPAPRLMADLAAMGLPILPLMWLTDHME